MDESVDKISDFIGNFDSLTKNPEEFLILENAAIKNSKKLLKQLYDFVKSVEEGNSNGKALPELIIKNFDEEQIWQEIELQNNDNIDKFTSGINWLTKRKDKLKFPVKLKDEDNGEEEGSANNLNENVSQMEVDGDKDSDSDNDDDFDDMEKEFTDNESVNSQDVSNEEKKEKKSKTKPSVVDDTFFKLAEMEEFLLAEEKREENDDEDNSADIGINLFDDIPSSENENEEEEEEQVRYKYKDFFQEPVNEETSEKSYSEKLKLEDDKDVEDLDDEENINTRYKFKDFFKKQPRKEKTEKSLREDDENFSEDDTNDEEDEMYFNDDGETNKNRDDNDLSMGEGEEKEEDDDEKDSKNNIKRVKFDLSGDDSDDEEDDKEKWKFRSDLNDEKGKSDEVKSTLEKRKERLSKHIMKLEETALYDKPWQMKGEISATDRPQNSLLEEFLEFDQTSRPAPVMTEATTERLEDIIIRRIKDKAWDDVERKLKPVETVNEFKKRLVLDQEKSKLSLAQIYEQEYIKQRDAATSVGLKAEDKEPEELPQHKEIKSKMVSLFAKLNSLANFHYTPKQAAPDIKIVSNLPAVTIEEVAPVSASDGTLLAPEEVLGKKNKDLIGKEEREKTDKKRERRKKKSWQRTKRKLDEARELLKGQQSKKYSLENATKDLKKLSNSRGVQIGKSSDKKAVKTSTAFFSRLQDEVTSKVHGQLKEKKKDKLVNAKKLKL